MASKQYWLHYLFLLHELHLCALRSALLLFLISSLCAKELPRVLISLWILSVFPLLNSTMNQFRVAHLFFFFPPVKFRDNATNELFLLYILGTHFSFLKDRKGVVSSYNNSTSHFCFSSNILHLLIFVLPATWKAWTNYSKHWL